MEQIGLKTCMIVIVFLFLSPDNTHFEYISKLLDNYDGYIFCEKPVVTKNTELNQLNNIDINKKKKIFFNF